MLDLLKIEWLKIKKYPAFWWMLVIVFLTYPGINIMFLNIYGQVTKGKEMANNIAKLLLGNPFAFPETWHTVAYFSSFFVLLPSILVIMLVTNEYNYKTHRQNIIDGWSRSQFITSKLMDVAIISFVVMIAYIAVAIGFGIYADSLSWNRWAEQLQYIPLFYLQTFAQLSIAFLLGYLVKKAFIALGIFLFYYLIVENILVGLMKWKKIELTRFLPFEISDGILVRPAFSGNFGKDAKAGYELALSLVSQQVILTIVLTSIIWLICYKVHKKRDIV
ncbi:MAG: ABC transporter permease [Sediminibacterium sp.]|nr:ABC transporter permease [Sediminibacterium sp.]